MNKFAEPHEPSVRHRAMSRAMLGLASLAVFLIYSVTAAPSAWWGDSLELTAAAHVLGIPHPTGYPLYILLGYGFQHALGFMDPGRAMTLLSALLQAAALIPLALFTQRLLSAQRRACAAADPACGCSMADLLPAIGIALIVGFSPTFWGHATFAEVYPLTCLLGFALTAALMTERPIADPVRHAALLGALTGLLALNHYSFLALAPWLGLHLLALLRDHKPRRLRILPAFAATTLAPVALYLLIPPRAAANPPLNWGDPSSLERFLWMIRGGQFTQVRISPDPLPGLMRWIEWWGAQFLPLGNPAPALAIIAGLIVLGLAAFGLFTIFRANKILALGLALSLAACAAFSMLYAIPDIHAYFLVGWPAMIAGLLTGVIIVARRAGAGEQGGPALRIARTVPALFGLLLLGANWGAIDKSEEIAPVVWGENVILALPENAVILTSGDNDIYALWYQQMVHGLRPDVAVFGTNFIVQGWYARYWERPGRPEIAYEIAERPPTSKLDYDVQLFHGTILPNLAAGKRVFVTALDPMVRSYLNPRPFLARLLPIEYYRTTLYPYGLPGPEVYELQPNPKLAAMSREDLTAEFRRWYPELQ